MLVYCSQSLFSVLVLLIRSNISDYVETISLTFYQFTHPKHIYARYPRYLKRAEIANTMAFPTVAPAFIIRTFNSLVFITLSLRELATLRRFITMNYYYDYYSRQMPQNLQKIKFTLIQESLQVNEICFQITFTINSSKNI